MVFKKQIKVPHRKVNYLNFNIMNRVSLMGRIGQDPELKTTNAGTELVKLSIATQRNQEITDWHRVTVFGQKASIINKFLSKGDQIIVHGSVQYGTYEKDGEKVYTTDIVCFDFDFVGGAKNDSAPADEPKAKPAKKKLKKKKSVADDDDFDL